MNAASWVNRLLRSLDVQIVRFKTYEYKKKYSALLIDQKPVYDCAIEYKDNDIKREPAIAFILQQPRDFSKLCAIEEAIKNSELNSAPINTVYVIDDFHYAGEFASGCVEKVEGHHKKHRLASDVVGEKVQFKMGVYQANTWPQFTTYVQKYAERGIRIQVPLSSLLSQTSVLAPPYYDDITSSFPEEHIRDSFSLYLTASERQCMAVERTLGASKVALIGYPQYWDAAVLKNPYNVICNLLSIHNNKPIIAYLPVPKSAKEFQKDLIYLAPLVREFNVIIQPHPDLHLPINKKMKDDICQSAHSLGIFINDGLINRSGLLVAGAKLVISEGVSSALSSIYLKANVVVGLSGFSPFFIERDMNINAGLTEILPSINRKKLSSTGLVQKLNESAYWQMIENSSTKLRMDFFGEIRPVDLSKKICSEKLVKLFYTERNLV